MKKTLLIKKMSLVLALFSIAWLPIAKAQKPLKYDEILELKKAEFKQYGYTEEKLLKKIGKYNRYWQDRLDSDGGLGQMTAAFGDEDGGRSNGVFCSTDDADWNPIGPFSYKGTSSPQWTGYVQEIYSPKDSSYVLIGAERGGIWKKDANSTQWVNTTDQLNLPIFQISSIEPDPFNPNHIYATCGGGAMHGQGILESNDGGDTWSILNGFTTSFCVVYPNKCTNMNDQYIDVRKMIIDPYTSTNGNLHFYALTRTDPSNTDIWESTDNGATWTSIGPNGSLPTHSVWVDIEVTDQGDLLCSSVFPFGSLAKFYIRDGGACANWCDRTNLIAPNSATKIYFTKPVGSKVFALSDNPVRSIYQSNDYGQTWNLVTTITAIAGAGPKYDIEYSPLVDRVFVGGLHVREVNPNNGAQSTITQGHVDIRDFWFVNRAGELHMYVANDGGPSLYNYSTGQVDILNDESLPILQFFDVGTAQMSQDRMIGGTTHNHSHALDNGTWKKVWAGDGNGSVISYDDPNLAYITANQYVSRYTFNGGTNNLIPTNGSTYKGGINIVGSHVYLNPIVPDFMYYINDKHTDGKNYINKWDESVDQWENIEVPYLKRPGQFAIAKSRIKHWYIAEASSSSNSTNTMKLLRSYDTGVTWTSIGATPIYDTNSNYLGDLNQALSWRRITDIEVNPYNYKQLWITISGFNATDEVYRVLESNDGGDTWEEHSQGLPRYPVHSIVYVEATNGLKFVGTESGIFYRDNSMSQWECFNNNMAHAQIMDLDINYCTAELIAATYGRGVWKSKIPGNLSPLVYSTNTTFAAGNTFQINSDIIVKAPAILTVKATVEMGRGKNIIVEPGATLVIDGGTITNQCDKLWGGIKLGGSPNLPQLSDANVIDPNQATLFMLNGATIQHSTFGATTQAYDYGFGHGARIFATKSKFVDNRFDVEMLKYGFSNVSYFRYMDFVTTGPLPDPVYEDVNGRALGTATHVRMWAVNDVEFFKNRFLNSGSFDQDIRGIGIFSLDADYTVQGSCNAYNQWNCVDPNLSFQNLSKGIVFNSSMNNNQLIVYNNLFENVVQGIYVNGGHGILIDDNHFLDYGGSNSFNGIDFMKSWGVYIDGTEGATVSDNRFRDNNAGSSPLDLYSRGVIAQNTGGFDSDVMRNVFEEGDMVGVQGWFNNDDLQIWCNDFHSEYGIYVSRDQSSFTPSTLPSQGTVTQPAGNMFFHGCNDQESHIYFDGIDPLSPLETVLFYNDYSNIPNGPTCNSSDFSFLPYANASNPPPGFVFVNPLGINYKDGVCNPQKGSEGGSERIGDIERQDGLIEFIDFVKSIEAENRDYLTLTPNELSILEKYSTVKSVEGSKALAILNFLGIENHVPYVLEMDPQSVVNPMKSRAELSNSVKLYPNPANHQISIEIDDQYRNVNFEVVDILGKLIYQSNDEKNVVIDVSSWNSGVYTVIFLLDETREIHKFIVSK